jgi:hypothetical protein
MQRVAMKDTHAVSFPDSLIVNDVRLFLTGVVVHTSNTIDLGHYTAFVSIPMSPDRGTPVYYLFSLKYMWGIIALLQCLCLCRAF